MNMRTWSGQTDMLTDSVHLMYCFLYAEACTYIVLEHESSSRICYCTVKFSAPKLAFIHYSMDLPTEVFEYRKHCIQIAGKMLCFIFLPLLLRYSDM